MTTIIISILAALGIGGGVMLASSGGGGSSSGGSAVVAPVNPGGGGSGGGEIGGGSSGGGQASSGSVSNLLANNPSENLSIIGQTVGDNTTLANKTLTMGMAVFAPVLVSGTNYKTTEVGGAFSRHDPQYGTLYDRYIKSYGTTPNVVVEFDLNTINSSVAKGDVYTAPTQTMQNIPTITTYNALDGYYHSPALTSLAYNNLDWSFTPTLILGGRKFAMQNSDFGYYNFSASLTDGNSPIDYLPYLKRTGAQQFYFFDTSKKLLAADYNRYSDNNNIATFNGVVIGAYHFQNNNVSCHTNYVKHITGDINIVLDFNNSQRKLDGRITNVIFDENSPRSWYDMVLTGQIQTDNSLPNIKITNVDLEMPSQYTYFADQIARIVPILPNSSYGSAVIVKGDTDEMVGEVAFLGQKENMNMTMIDVHLAFGAKKE